MLSLEQIAEATGGQLRGAPAITVTSVSTDSRNLYPEALFVALKGPRFDGHDYIEKAVGAGAAAVLVSSEGALTRIPAGRGAVLVTDTLVALQELARWHRRRMPARVAALTGSAGKTTTKELIAAILAQEGATLATRGNLNNHIGVPLTLLGLEPSHRFAVIEMGCNNFGEIDLLAGLAEPRFGLITNVGAAHLEGLGDLAGVARAKGELFRRLPGDGAVVVNVDDARVAAISSPASRRVTYGSSADAEVRLVSRSVTSEGLQELRIVCSGAGVDSEPEELAATIGLLGRHNAHNALAAAALARAMGASSGAVIAGLAEARPAPGRLEPRVLGRGLLLIDDTYNANPDSMAAALAVLSEYGGKGRKLHAILGEMLELGDEREAAHKRIGALAAAGGLESLVGVGEVGALYERGALEAGQGRDGVLTAPTPEDAAQLVLGRLRGDDVILVKGSRGAHMERAVELVAGGLEKGSDFLRK